MSLVVEKTRVWNAPEQALLGPLRAKENIETRATRRLRKSPYLSVRRVVCEFHGGMLSLRGRVPSYYLKQIAQTIVLGMDGVDEIDNQLEVVT